MKYYLINYIVMVLMTSILQSLGAKFSSNLFKDRPSYIDRSMYEIQQSVINIGVLVGKLIVGVKVETRLYTVSFAIFVHFFIFFSLCFLKFKWNLIYLVLQFTCSILRGILFSSVICLIMID